MTVGLIAGLVFGAVGCVRTSPPAGTAPQRPSLPVATVAVPAPAEEVPDGAVMARAVAAARAGDYAGARRAIEAMEDRPRRARLAGAVAAALAEVDAGSATRFAGELAAGHAQLVAVEVAGKAWAARDPEGALRWAHGMAEPEAAGRARAAVAEVLVRVDPEAAIKRVMALPAGPARDATLIVAVAAWARHEDKGAVAWLRGFRGEELGQRLTSAVGFELAQKNPRAAVELAETLPPGRNRWLLVSAIGQTWVALDLKGALAWAHGLPAGEARDAAFAGVDTGLGIPTTRRIASAPGTRGGASRTRGSGAAVAGSGAGLLAEEFENWLASQPAGMSRDDAIAEYVRQRGPLQPGVVGPWVVGLPGGPARDRALEVFFDGLLRGSPAEAANWLRTLPPSDRNDDRTEKAAQRWLSIDPEAARAWLRETHLPLDRQERLLRDAPR